MIKRFNALLIVAIFCLVSAGAAFADSGKTAPGQRDGGTFADSGKTAPGQRDGGSLGDLTKAANQTEGWSQGSHASDPSGDGKGKGDSDQPRSGLANVAEKGDLSSTLDAITK